MASVLGPAPLLRHDAEGRLCLQEEGLHLLRQATAPAHVAFAVGGSRCGKSTACNALLFGQDSDGKGCFETGSSFDPVTTGVDIALKKLSGGGSLVVADCEGAFHICGSAQSARGFGDLGLLAYHLGSVVLHVSMGSIDERDIEVLGHLAASAQSVLGPSAGTQDDNGTGPQSDALHIAAAPTLLLVVNGARFDLGDAVARRLLRPPETANGASRNCARTAIARGFRSRPALEALPSCDHQAYWAKVEGLRRRLFDSPASVSSNGLLASGLELADRMALLVSHLNGEALSMQLEPEPAAEAMLRRNHLEPLVDEIANKFAATGAGPSSSSTPPRSEGARSKCKPSSPDKRALDEALAEFDDRCTWLTSSSKEGPAPVRLDLVHEVRERLSSRLTGICDALARGRQEAILRRPSSLSRLQIQDSPALSSESGNRTPTPPCTPSRKRRSLSALQASLHDAEQRVENLHSGVAGQICEIRKAFAKAEKQAAEVQQEAVAKETEIAAGVMSWQEDWQERLHQLASKRVRVSDAQAVASDEAVMDLRAELRGTEAFLPDIVSCASLLEDVRGRLEELQLTKRQVAESATRTLEEHVQELRAMWEEEVMDLGMLRAHVSNEFGKQAEALRASLQEERQQRADRHRVMSDVVSQLRSSLEATLQADDTLLPSSCFSTPAPVQQRGRRPGTPSRWKSDKVRTPEHV